MVSYQVISANISHMTWYTTDNNCSQARRGEKINQKQWEDGDSSKNMMKILNKGKSNPSLQIVIVTSSATQQG